MALEIVRRANYNDYDLCVFSVAMVLTKGNVMLKNTCCACKILALIVVLGAINWGVIAIFQVDYIAKFLPPTVVRVIYGLVGLAGLIMLAGFFFCCPKCNKDEKNKYS